VSDANAAELLRRWCRLAQLGLGVAREEIDTLNVFPVPDGDTGTNVYLTFEAAVTAMHDCDEDDLPGALRALGRGALLGARGNSGVIVSQLLRAMGEHLAAELPAGAGADAGRRVAESFRVAADAAYTAVAKPVEGTMLTVARAVAEAAAVAADAGGGVAEVISESARAGREALARTPDQLAVLRRAGVVDAGGRALCVLLDAAETAVTGRRHSIAGAGRGRRGAKLSSVTRPGASEAGAGGPTYEVMYLLDADDTGVSELRDTLGRLGDSLVVVGGDGLWNVHVHVDDVGAAVEAGLAAGTPRRIRVTHLAEQSRQHADAAPAARAARSVVVVAAGPGLAELFAAAGATVIRAGPGRRCSTSDILAAIDRAGCAEVVVLPNDPDSISVAEAAAQAARDGGVRVSVVPTRAQVQGLAAIAVHDPARRFDDDVVAMTAAAGHTRHGAVTVALRDAITMAGPCRSGDALGVVDGDFAVVGHDIESVGMEVVTRLLAAGGELVTLVTGLDADAGLAHSITEQVRRDHPEVDAVVYDGGQTRYPLLVAVE